MEINNQCSYDLNPKDISSEEWSHAISILKSQRVALFIVAYNAQHFIKSVLDRIPDQLIPLFNEIFIIDDILFAPVNGLIFIAEKINDVLEKETSDEGVVKERLMALQLRFELDEIDEEEYDREEDELLKKLERIRLDKQSQ